MSVLNQPYFYIEVIEFARTGEFESHIKKTLLAGVKLNILVFMQQTLLKNSGCPM